VIAWVVDFRLHPRRASLYPSASSFSILSAFRFLFSPHPDFLCFHGLTNCPICNSFLFITIQQWGVVCTPSASSAVNCKLSAVDSPSPLECAVPRFRPLSPLECADPKTHRRNPFRMRSSEKRWGGGGSLFLRSPLATRHSPLFPGRSFRVHRGAEDAHFVRGGDHFKPAALQRAHFHHFVDQPV